MRAVFYLPEVGLNVVHLQRINPVLMYSGTVLLSAAVPNRMHGKSADYKSITKTINVIIEMVSDEQFQLENPPFREGNMYFKPLSEDPGDPKFLFVQQSNLGAGFHRTKPTIIRMKKKGIEEIRERQKGNEAARNMNTIGQRPSMRARMRDPRPRKRYFVTHDGRVAVTAAHR
jgi:hypothetical protein